MADSDFRMLVFLTEAVLRLGEKHTELLKMVAQRFDFYDRLISLRAQIDDIHDPNKQDAAREQLHSLEREVAQTTAPATKMTLDHVAALETASDQLAAALEQLRADHKDLF